MQINSCTNKIKCDVFGCRNLAKYSFSSQNEKKTILALCDDCAKEIYTALLSVSVPKNIPAPFKNQKKIGVKK